MQEEIHDLYGAVDIEAMYQQAIRQPLDRKIAQAVALIQMYEGQALQLSPDGYYVAFSGGKDSIVLERLFKMAGVKYQAWYNNVTIDPPELVQFIKREYPHVPWNNHGRHLCAEIQDHATGLPTRTCRWCCEIYKEQGGNGTFKAVGVRAEESKRRKGLWTQVKTVRGGSILAPILYWTTEDVWRFIGINALPYCELYDQGFDRLGCVGCPLGGKNRRKEFARWPKYEAMWKRGGRVWWEKYRDKRKFVPDIADFTTTVIDEETGVVTITDSSAYEEAVARSYYFAHKFPTFEAYWSWWMEEKNVDDTDEPDCQLWLI